MDLYEAFKSIIEKNDIKILDDTSKCENMLKQKGFRGDDLNTKLFFAVLRQNVPLKIRTLTYSNKNYSNYTLSIKIFCELFGKENLNNEYEDILIRHISLIVSVFETEKVINLDLNTEHIERKALSLSKTILESLDKYGISVLENRKLLKSILDDLCDEKEAIHEFLEFLNRINSGTVDLDNQQEVEDIKKFVKLLGKRDYLPLSFVLEELQNAELQKNEESLPENVTKAIKQEQDNSNNQSEIIKIGDKTNRDTSVDNTVIVQKKSGKNHFFTVTELRGIVAVLIFLFIITILAIINNNSDYSSYSSGQTSNTYDKYSSYSTAKSSNITRTLYVNVDGLNVRSAASADSRIVGTLALGDSITTTDPTSQKWIYVRGKYNGYVNSNYLSSNPVSKNRSSSNSSQNTTGQDNVEDNLDLSQKNTKFKE